MSTNHDHAQCLPYVEFKPGQLIAAEVMNDMQCQIREDITTQSQAAVDKIIQVPGAKDSEKLEGQSLQEISQAIINQAISQMTQRSGYMRLYKKLAVGKEMVIEHGLQNAPLVDAYQLDYFRVVAAEDDYKYITWVNFFIYHTSEKRIRFVPEGATGPESVEIEPTEGQAYRIPFKELLTRYGVKYSDESSLGDLETEFWDALFAAPNDRFDDNQYAHSPWFDRCCRDERTVRSLKQKGDWDSLWVKVVPRRTENYPSPAIQEGQALPTPAPTQLQVTHFDLNRMGITLLRNPVYAKEVADGLTAEQREDALNELKVMLLLRA